MRSVFILTVVLGLLAVFGPALAPHDPSAIDIPNRPAPPGRQYPLGTDALGRGVLSRLLHGASWSLGLAFIVSVIGLIAGTLIGLVAAMAGRLVDWVVMRASVPGVRQKGERAYPGGDLGHAR